MSLLNAILDLPDPIVDVVIENPFNARDFMDDKLSVLDIRASDQRGWVYDIEMQVSVYSGLIQRLVYYGCEVYAGQLRSGDDYSILKPIYTICFLEGIEFGELFGEIRVLQKILGMAQSTDDELKSIERSELQSLASNLEVQLRQRLD
jgi:predicted transposase/invertase (TIGR01784 family)